MGKLLLIGMLLSGAILSSCGKQTDDAQIRAIVRQELDSLIRTERRAITDAYTVGPYSPAQRVGNFLFVSGQIALNQETGELVTGSIETETKQALANLFRILKQEGMDSSNVISTTVYLTDINDYPAMNVTYGGYFEDGNYPARTTVQVTALPRKARIEIAAIAYAVQH